MFRMMAIVASAAFLTAPLAAQEVQPPKADEKTKTDENALKDGDVFKTADRNGDGKVTIQEVRDLRKNQLDDWRKIGTADDPAKAREDYDDKYKDRLDLATFLRYDADDNDELTSEEFESYGMGDAPEFTGADAEAYGDLVYDEWTGFVGVRGDELKISDYAAQMQKHRAELKARAGTNLESRYTTLRYNSRLRDYHDLLIADSNDDGVVNRAEAREYWQKTYNGRIDGKLNDKDGELFSEARYHDRVSALDANDDGILSREETRNAYDAPSDERFKELDTNGDGDLGRDEIRNWEMTDDIRPRMKDGSNNPNRKEDGSDLPDRKGDGSDNPKKDADGKGGSKMPEKK